MKNVIKPLSKRVLISLALPAAVSAADAGIHKKIVGWGHRTSHDNNKILIKSNDEMKGNIRIVKPLEDSGLLFNGVSQTV